MNSNGAFHYWKGQIMENNLLSRVTTLEKQRGDTGYKIVEREAGETKDEARARVGLADWRGLVIFASEIDVRL